MGQAPQYQAPRTRDPVEVPMGLEYSPPACEETWGPSLRRTKEGIKCFLEELGGLRHIASVKKV
jgi:Tfp pilus assembly protein PilP